jgi:alpha-glucosidase (family GH31 glycosyl hydrolase)
MKNAMTRREALKSVAAIGSTALLVPQITLGQEQPIQISGLPVEIQLTPVSASNVRISIVPVASNVAQPVTSIGTLVRSDFGKPIAGIRTLAGTRTVKCGELSVKITPNPLTIGIEGSDGSLIQELKIEESSGRVSFQYGKGPVLGLGQGGPQFDRRGKLDQMRSGQGGYQLATHGAKVPVQFLVGTSGWAMFIHQPLGAFDLTGDTGNFRAPEADPAMPIDIFVIGEKQPAKVMGEFAKLTGLPEMAPLWSFGYQQSHRTLDAPEEIMKEARTFREKKLPCDMMIYLGTGFCPNGWNTYNGEFVWNPKAFPEPNKMIRELHDQHFKVVLHIVVEARKFTGTVADTCTAEPLPTGRRPDGSWPNDRQTSCYWPAHKPLFDLGIDGWWPDQGDGLDGPSRLARNRMYFDGSQIYRPNERVYALHRNGFPGMQRFASFLWSGDVQSRWETLENHVPIAINTGLSGIPYWGTDIGGFVPTAEFTGELYARWFQFAAFNPLFRSHGRDWKLRLPWGWDLGTVGFPETPSYNPDPKELHNTAIEPVCKKYLELRYQLMPYLYSAVRETCETGVPIIRALWFRYPDDPVAVARGDEYLWGRDILVAPVVKKGATSRALYLPRGTWYDFWTQEKVEGGKEINRAVDLATMPLYVSAGSVIPVGPIKQYTAEQVDGPLTLWVYPGGDANFTLYEDDGNTFNFRKGEFMKVDISWKNATRQLGMRLAAGSRMLPPAKRNIVIRVAGEKTVREAVFDGRPVDVKL